MVYTKFVLGEDARFKPHTTMVGSTMNYRKKIHGYRHVGYTFSFKFQPFMASWTIQIHCCLGTPLKFNITDITASPSVISMVLSKWTIAPL